ncbi:MAG: TlpA disulfide reductase family protein [Chitinophagales bacterium]
MKYLSIVCLVFSIFISCNQEKEQGFSIAAEVVNGDNKLVKISAREDGQWIDLDTAVINDGKFNLNGTIEEPQMLYLRIMDEVGFRYVPIFSNNSDKISIEGDLSQEDDMIIEGSELNNLYSQFSEKYQVETEPLEALYEMLDSSEDDFLKDSLMMLIDQVDQSSEAFVLSFIKGNMSSPIAAYLLLREYSYGREYDELKPIYDELVENNNTSKYLKDINEKLAKLKITAIGEPAPNFIQTDQNGEAFDISSLKGKYVLLDFWASWCVPCRNENPNVVALYNEVDGKDFEILGVSLDKNEAAWKQAIEDDGLEWKHVSDLKYWKNDVAQLYGVSAIPQTFLLDKEGIIIAKNLRGEKLKSKVKELLEIEG